MVDTLHLYHKDNNVINFCPFYQLNMFPISACVIQSPIIRA